MEVFWKQSEDVLGPRQAAEHDVPGEAVQGGHQLWERRGERALQGSTASRRALPAAGPSSRGESRAPSRTCAASSGLPAMAGQARCASGPRRPGGQEKHSWHSCRTASFDDACRGAKREVLSSGPAAGSPPPPQDEHCVSSPSAGSAGRRNLPRAPPPPSWRRRLRRGGRHVGAGRGRAVGHAGRCSPAVLLLSGATVGNPRGKLRGYFAQVSCVF